MSYFATEPAPYTPIKYTLWLVPDQSNKYYTFDEKVFPTNENAGFDLVSMDSSFDPTVGHRRAFMTNFGVRAMMTRGDTLSPEATVHYRLVPRSSIYKTGYMMANSEGIIDRTYTGVLKAPLIFTNPQSEHAGMWEGNKYFQIVAPDLGWIHKVRVVSSLPVTQRGDGGFGSTDSSGSTGPAYASTDLSGRYMYGLSGSTGPSAFRSPTGSTRGGSGPASAFSTIKGPSTVSTIYSMSSQPNLSTFSTLPGMSSLSSPSTMCSTNSISYIYSFSNPPSTVAVITPSSSCMSCT